MYDDRFCIVRCYGAGVFFARVKRLDGQNAELCDVRRLWYWAGACSLSQLAQEGTKRPGNCKFTITIPTMTVTQVLEIIPCSDAAVESISRVPEWKIS